MANTFTTNFNLTKPEVGGANDTWGELVNTNYTSIDTELFRKADKNDQKGVTHTLTFTSGSTNVTTNVTRGFASFNVDDKITISNLSSDADNKGEFKIEGITNDVTLDLKKTDDSEPTFSTETISSTVSIIAEINKIEGSLDVSSDTLTTSTAQKDAIVDGSTAITRSSNDIAIAGDLTVTGGDIKSSGGTTAISLSGADTTLAGTANNIGTVTAGTISDTVTMTGVPRRTKITVFSSGSNVTCYTDQVERSITTPISFDCKQNRVYVIDFNGTFLFNYYSGSFATLSTTRIRSHTSSVSSNTASPSGTEIIKLEIHPQQTLTSNESYYIRGIYEHTSSDDTIYFFLTGQSNTSSYQVIYYIGNNGRNLVGSVQEYDSDIITNS